jgi:2-polyprenyl-6-hydroxyphenyl methylase/3-demethylubiquinone-9 3-methyltransferase
MQPDDASRMRVRENTNEEPERRSSDFLWYNADPTAVYLLPVVRSIVNRLARRTGAGRLRVADIGCGNGFVAADLAGLGHEVMGIDISASGIRLAKERGSAARFELCSLYDDRIFDLMPESADCVLALEVIEHLVRPRRLFEVARCLLRVEGLIVVSTPHHGYLKNLALSLVNGWDRHFEVAADGGHIKFFSRRTLTALATEQDFRDLRFLGAGRIPAFWKSIVMSARRG